MYMLVSPKITDISSIVDVSVTRFSCCYETHGVLYRVPTSDFVGIVYSGYIHRINVAFLLSKQFQILPKSMATESECKLRQFYADVTLNKS